VFKRRGRNPDYFLGEKDEARAEYVHLVYASYHGHTFAQNGLFNSIISKKVTLEVLPQASAIIKTHMKFATVVLSESDA